MKNVFIVLIISLCSMNSFAQSGVAGKWNTGDQNTIVKIEQQNGVFIGKIVSSDNPKAQPGTIILKVVKAKKDRWSAKLFAPKRGEWYDGEIIMSSNKLVIEISVGFFSKTIEWTKVNS